MPVRFVNWLGKPIPKSPELVAALEKRLLYGDWIDLKSKDSLRIMIEPYIAVLTFENSFDWGLGLIHFVYAVSILRGGCFFRFKNHQVFDEKFHNWRKHRFYYTNARGVNKRFPREKIHAQSYLEEFLNV